MLTGFSPCRPQERPRRQLADTRRPRAKSLQGIAGACAQDHTRKFATVCTTSLSAPERGIRQTGAPLAVASRGANFNAAHLVQRSPRAMMMAVARMPSPLRPLPRSPIRDRGICSSFGIAIRLNAQVRISESCQQFPSSLPRATVRAPVRHPTPCISPFLTVCDDGRRAYRAPHTFPPKVGVASSYTRTKLR